MHASIGFYNALLFKHNCQVECVNSPQVNPISDLDQSNFHNRPKIDNVDTNENTLLIPMRF